jgi:hypothetical protein
VGRRLDRRYGDWHLICYRKPSVRSSWCPSGRVAAGRSRRADLTRGRYGQRSAPKDTHSSSFPQVSVVVRTTASTGITVQPRQRAQMLRVCTCMESGYPTNMSYADIDPTGLHWYVRTYFDVLNELLDIAGKSPGVFAIDGHSGSGKTTLADGLAALEPRAVVIHTDDLAWHHSFFDWGDLLPDQLVLPLRKGLTPISYLPEAWMHRGPAGTITIPEDTSAVFIEGVGSARREVRPWLDAVVWVHAREAVGRRRVASRGFVNDWMKQENAFLAEHRPWEIADVLVAGELGQPAPDGRYGNVVTAPGPTGVGRRV